MSYLIFRYLRLLLDTEEDSKEPKSDIKMGANTSINAMTGIHAPTIGAAIGITVGVLIFVAVFQFYQLRKQQKKIKMLMASSGLPMYNKKSNPFAYQNLGLAHQNCVRVPPQNNQNLNNQNQVQQNPGGFPDV